MNGRVCGALVLIVRLPGFYLEIVCYGLLGVEGGMVLAQSPRQTINITFVVLAIYLLYFTSWNKSRCSWLHLRDQKFNLLIVLTHHVVTQLFFKTQLGQRIMIKYRFTRQFNDSENDEQVGLVITQDSEEGKPATYTPRLIHHLGRDAVPLTYFVHLRSMRNTTDSESGSAKNYELENELKPKEQEINSSTAYTLMK
jgi:hypothetical protein